MDSTQRYARLQLIAWKLLELHHIDPLLVFLKVGLDPQEMYNEGVYHIDNIKDLWDEMSKRIANPSYGLKAGTCWHPSFIGPLGYALLSAPSLRSTLEKFIEFNPFITNEKKSSCSLIENIDEQSLTFAFPNEDLRRPGTFGRQDSFVACMMSILQINYVGDLSPVRIEFNHTTPTRPGDYFSLFKGPVFFNQPQTSITIRLVDADCVLPLSPAEMQKATEHELKTYMIQKKGLSFTYRLGLMIEKHIEENISIDFIAQKFSLSAKSLQRLLKKEETTYSEVLDLKRFELAKIYLIDIEKAMSDISFLLGYSEQSAFSRSFKKLSGISPTEYRERHTIKS